MKRRFLAMLLSVAMVLTMLPVTAFAADPAGSDGTVALTELPSSLTVRAIKSVGADSKITLKVTVTDGGAAVAVDNFYYKTAASADSITAPEDGAEITEEDDWKEYKEPFTVGDQTVGEVAVVQVVTVEENNESKLTAKAYGSTSNIYNALGELTVEVKDNAITVKEGENPLTTGVKYYALAADKLEEFNTARTDWASDTALTELTSTLSATEITDESNNPSAKITKTHSGKYIVVVKTGGTSNDKIASLGVTEQVAKFVKPFKLFLGEPADTTTATDVIADIEEADSTYTVTVPVDTEKLTVSPAEGVTATVSTTNGNVTVNDKVVTLDASAATHSFKVSVDSVDYSITVARVKPSLKASADSELIAEATRNGNVFTVAEQANSVKSLTLSVPENALKLTLKSAGVEYANGSTGEVQKGLVYLEDGLNTITVTFSDNSTCKIKVTRTAAAPGVALYAGAKAEGDDLLADLAQNPAGEYSVTVPSTTTQVTVGATAGTIASVAYKPTGSTSDPVTVSNKVVPVTSAGVAITVKFNDSTDTPTTFTINVTQSAAFVNLTVAEGTGDNVGKVVVTAPEEVPAGLQVVVLSKDPAWTETTAASKVATDIEGAIVATDAYNDGTMAIPAAGESDQYVVVYKTDESFVTHYGVYKVAKVDRELTVKDSSDANAESMITFDPAVHEYAVSVDKSVTGVKIEALPGNTRMTVSSGSTMSNGVVEKMAAGGVSTVTVQYMDVAPTASYTIKLVWPMDANSIAPNHQVVTKDVTAVDGAAEVAPAETEVLTAISNTLTANDRDGKDNPVQITATSSAETAEEDLADTTTVTLPASAAELLQDTGIDAKVVTDAGEVTIPSEAIAQTQPGTEDSPAAPVAIAVVVAKKEVAAPTEGGIVEAAKFEVTVKKATEDGMVDAGIKDLAKPITLVFKVRKDAIGEMKNPRLAYVKPAATVGGKPTYEKLPEAPEPTFDETTQIYTFTGKTSHLSEFAVVAEEATTEPVTPGPNITDITLTDGENPISGFEFKTGTDTYNVTVPSTVDSVSITVTAKDNNYTNVVVSTSGAGETTGDSDCDGTTAVRFTLSNEGKATIYVKINGTPVYTINVTKEADPTVKEITNIKLTAEDGTTEVAGFTFAKGTTTYTVETDENPVLVTVEGDTDNVTVNGTKYTDAVEVVPTAAGTKVTIAYGDGTAQKYEITLKTKSTTPVDPTAPVSNKVLIGSKEQTVTFNDANEKGERISKETLTMESTDETVTLTIADGAIVKLDGVVATGVLLDDTYTVTVEEPGDHTITVTDSKGNNPYIINLNKKPAVVDETKVPTGDDGEKIDFTKNDEGVLEGTVTVEGTASSYKLNVGAGATKVLVNGAEVDIPADGVIEIPITSSGTQKIEITNSDGSKYIVNLEKQPAPGSLKAEQNGMTVSTYANVEISNLKAGKYYLVEITVPATRGSKETSSYMVLEGDSYPSGVAKIAPAAGCKVVVNEYDSLADFSNGETSAIKATARCNTTLITD